jgi:hypothetical protein
MIIFILFDFSYNNSYKGNLFKHEILILFGNLSSIENFFNCFEGL